MAYTIPDLGPSDLLTSGKEGLRRLKVEDDESAFYEGRQFRTFQDFTIPALTSIAIRATVGTNIILHETSLTGISGDLKMELFIGGTADGPWTALPVIPKNTMTTTPAVTSQVTLDHNGTHTGGTRIDALLVGAANKGVSVGGTESSKRGVGPGTYYYRVTNTSNQQAECVFSGHWEEL